MSFAALLRYKKILSLIPMLASFVVTAGCSTPRDPVEAMNEEVRDLFSSSGMTALSIALVNEDVVSTYHYGEFSDGSLPSDDTIYDIGSITKTHTGLILAQAVSDGLIGLDDPISQYLDAIPSKALTYQGAEITVRHLATHTSGLPTDLACADTNLTPNEKLICYNDHDDADLVRVLSEYKAQNMPGIKYKYSNSGIRILGIILESLYGKNMEQLLQDVVFKSTGQIETYAYLPEGKRVLWRRGVHENGLPTPDGSGYFNAAGGLKATVPDMARYTSFYFNGDNLLAKKALTLLAGEENGLGRAYIWNTYRLTSEGQYYHGGGTFGSSAWISIYPEEKLGIFLVTPYASSSGQEELNMLANEIIEIHRRQRKFS